MKKIRVGVLFGGVSSEHEISLLSAQNVISALDEKKYEIVKIGISKSGEFLKFENEICENGDDAKKVKLSKNGEKVIFENEKLDAIFPIIHGGAGENGELQGFLKILKIPFVGPDAAASAICFDKEFTKIILKNAGIAVADGISIRKNENFDAEKIGAKFGFPLFVKPARAGSSVGVFKVKNSADLKNAVSAAFEHDEKILVETAIVGREIEIAILGNSEKMRASEIAEIVPRGNHEFYDFDAKYCDGDGAEIVAPAAISENEKIKFQNLAQKVAAVLGIEGMSRVDGFLKSDGEIVINEINTIPGFTNISMYPKLWGLSGISQKKLVDELLSLAIARGI